MDNLFDWSSPVNGRDVIVGIVVTVTITLITYLIVYLVNRATRRRSLAVQGEEAAREASIAGLPSLLHGIDNASSAYWWGYSDPDNPNDTGNPIEPGDKWEAIHAVAPVSELVVAYVVKHPVLDERIVEWLRDLVRPLDVARSAPTPLSNKVIHEAGLKVTHTIVQVNRDTGSDGMTPEYFASHPAAPFQQLS